MAEPKIELIRATVGHSRLWPKRNAFKYHVFYLKVLVEEIDNKTPTLFSFNKRNVLSMHNKDHGSREGDKSWHQFITDELIKAKIKIKRDYRYYLIAHPRIFGYAFNPISYWLVVDGHNKLRVVLCEVHNTFKQTHNYLLTKANDSPILPDDILVADKQLYVSPFNKIEGHYEFSFSYENDQFKSVINYFDKNDRHILNTYVGGRPQTLTTTEIFKLLFSYPLMTIMVVARIHWQAIKLYLKGVKETLKFKPKSYKNNRTTVSKKNK